MGDFRAKKITLNWEIDLDLRILSHILSIISVDFLRSSLFLSLSSSLVFFRISSWILWIRGVADTDRRQLNIDISWDFSFSLRNELNIKIRAQKCIYNHKARQREIICVCVCWNKEARILKFQIQQLNLRTILSLLSSATNYSFNEHSQDIGHVTKRVFCHVSVFS